MSSVANYNIEDNSGANVRIDLNAVFAAIQSNNSETSDLATSKCVAGMTFLNSTSNELKIRNSSNGAFTTIGNIDQPNLGLLSKSGGTMTGQFLADDSNSASAPAISFDTDTDLGLFRKSANIMGFSSAGTEQMVFDANGLTLKLQNEVRFGDNDSSHYIGLKASSTIGTSFTLTLPTADGSSGQFLKTDGSGTLSFGTVSLTALSASNLTSGTVPDARFPATLPAVSGANLTSITGKAFAYINFNSVTNSIRSDFNFSSITDHGVGNFTCTFTNSASNNDYAVTMTGSSNEDNNATTFELSCSGPNLNSNSFSESNFTTSGFRFVMGTDHQSTPRDCKLVCAIVHQT
tara:strand:+ start:1794 stop:2837 length:1044 start_codon:yes stop_codon:yes gene_type:complete